MLCNSSVGFVGLKIFLVQFSVILFYLQKEEN